MYMHIWTSLRRKKEEAKEILNIVSYIHVNHDCVSSDDKLHQLHRTATCVDNSKKHISTIRRTVWTTQRKYFDYFVFNIVDYICVNCALPRSGARHRALAQTIDNTRGLDINSPLSVEAHTQDLRLHRHQQHGDPNNARGLDNNFASDCGYNSTTTTRLRHHRLRRGDPGTPDKS
jgi:hypothetical protein